MLRRDFNLAVLVGLLCPFHKKKEPKLNLVYRRNEEGSFPYWEECCMSELRSGEMMKMCDPETKETICEGITVSGPYYYKETEEWCISVSLEDYS